MQTEHISLTDTEDSIARAEELVRRFAAESAMSAKAARRLRLLAEETLSLAQQIIGEASADFAIGGSADLCRISLELDKRLDDAQMQDLLSMTLTGENQAYRGFMGTIRALIANPSEIGSHWTLQDYRQMLAERPASDAMSQEAIEDLERSIVANLAENVEVTLRGTKVLMVITAVL